MKSYFITKSKTPVSSRVYGMDDEGRINYWYDKESKWYFLNTAHRAKVLALETVFETSLFENIEYELCILVESEALDLLLLSEEHSNAKLHSYVKKLWKVSLNTLDECFQHADALESATGIVNRQIALESHVEELIRGER